MWINNNISKPLRKGYYKTLVDFDGLGSLKEYQKEFYNGLEFDWCMSNAQFIEDRSPLPSPCSLHCQAQLHLARQAADL